MQELSSGQDAGELEVLPDGRFVVLRGTEGLRRKVERFIADGIPIVRDFFGVDGQVAVPAVALPDNDFFAAYLEGELKGMGYRSVP